MPFVTDAEWTDAWEEARRTWPGAELPRAAFAVFAQPRIEAAGGARTHVSDLYLAGACLARCPAALRHFDDLCRVESDRVLRAARYAATRDDLRQTLLHKLLVGGNTGPQLNGYVGRGSLARWIRVAITRIAIDQTDEPDRELAAPDDLLAETLDVHDNPELQYLKNLYAREFRAAFSEAMTTLSPRERNLIQYAFIDGATVDAIAILCKVPRSTAGRWVLQAREKLLMTVQTIMRNTLQVTPTELESIWRLFDTWGHVWISEEQTSSGALDT